MAISIGVSPELFRRYREYVESGDEFDERCATEDEVRAFMVEVLGWALNTDPLLDRAYELLFRPA
jgi:hypothetical protein